MGITAIGEMLIDFTPCAEKNAYKRNPGGAPANVLAMAKRLGIACNFIGKVGDDSFGEFLKETLVEAQIDVSGLIVTKEYNTTLAFVELDDHGDRSFTFYRKKGADIMLLKEEIDKSVIENCNIFHFGSVSLTGEPSRTATLYAVEHAKKIGKIISYDPNFRPLLWENEKIAKQIMLEAMKYADIIKVSREELELLTGTSELDSGAKALLDYGASLVLVSLGAEGAFYATKNHSNQMETFDVKVVDTTGAGDAFLGAILYKLSQKTIPQIGCLSKNELDEILIFGNAAGSLTTTSKGAIPAMPTKEEIDNLISTL